MAHAGWSLVQDLERFDQAGNGEPWTEKYREQWEWRARKDPLRLEMLLRETMAHVREKRHPHILGRARWIKAKWRKAEAAPPSRTPEDAELARRVHQELSAHLGVSKS